MLLLAGLAWNGEGWYPSLHVTDLFVHDLFAAAIVVVTGGHIWMAMNDAEARLLTECHNLRECAARILDMGPSYVVIKKGEHGAFLIGEDVQYALPAYPVQEVVDPTGAGDSFAGGFMGDHALADPLGRTDQSPRIGQRHHAAKARRSLRPRNIL